MSGSKRKQALLDALLEDDSAVNSELIALVKHQSGMLERFMELHERMTESTLDKMMAVFDERARMVDRQFRAPERMRGGRSEATESGVTPGAPAHPLESDDIEETPVSHEEIVARMVNREFSGQIPRARG